MSAPTPPDRTAELLRRNPPKDRNARARELLRKHPPTPLGGTALLGGPGQEEALAATQEMGEVQQRAGLSHFPTAVETGAAITGGIIPGGALAARLGSGMASRLGTLGAEIVGRGTGAATGGVLGSELLASSEETPSEAQERRNIAGATAVMGEAGTPLLQRLVTRGILHPIRAKFGGLGAKELLELGAEESQALLESMGQTLTPGQLRIGRLIDTFENIIAASFGGGQVMSLTHQRAEAAAIQSIEKAIPNFTRNLNTEDAGKLLQGTLRGEVRLDRAATSGAYRAFARELEQAGGIGEIVNIQRALDLAKERLGVDPKDAGGIEVVSALRNSGGLPLTFEAAERLRGDLLSIARRGLGILPSRKILANELATEVDKAIGGATLTLGRFGPAVTQSLARARALSKISHDRWDHELIANLIDAVKPEDLPGIVLAENNPTQVRMVMEVLRDRKYRLGQLGPDGKIVPPIRNPEGIIQKLKSSYVLMHQEAAGHGKSSLLSGKLLRQDLDKAGGTARELFTPEEFQNLYISSRAIELIQKTAGKGQSGAIFMQLTQAGALGVILGFAPSSESKTAGAGFILLAPIAASLALTSRGFSRYMMQMAKTSESRVGRLTASAAAQTISHLVREKIPFTWNGEDGQVIEHDPSQAPTSSGYSQKPQSKF